MKLAKWYFMYGWPDLSKTPETDLAFGFVFFVAVLLGLMLSYIGWFCPEKIEQQCVQIALCELSNASLILLRAVWLIVGDTLTNLGYSVEHVDEFVSSLNWTSYSCPIEQK